MLKPTFSVIIPAYNAEATLRTTVASVLNQSFSDFEIIIVDDGSTDGTLLAMLDAGCMDIRVRAVSQSNAGVSAARNFGVSLARGRFLAFLDADDQWTFDKLQKHFEFHEADALIDGSFAQVAFCADGSGVLPIGRTVSKVDAGYSIGAISINDVVVQNPVCTTSNFVVSRRAFNAIGGFNENLRYAEDQELLTRLVSQGVTIGGIDQTLVKYRMSEDGLSCDFEAMLDGWRTFAGDWLQGDDFAHAEATYCRYLARRALRAGASMPTVRSYVRRGLAAHRSTFMAARSRSILTICGAFAGGLLPVSMRRAVFA
ncbi:MAG: glycosyltransferase family 2 protein [Erythrobacter sp.]